MVPAYSHKVSRVSWYSGSCRPVRSFAYGAFTLFGRPSQGRSAGSSSDFCSPNPITLRAMVWALSGSLAATSEITFVFFSSGYLDVSVHRVPLHTLWIQAWIRRVFLRGFPHSDICGSLDICSSPQLFAAYHVFLRLSVPRHPPCALIRLTFPCIALHVPAGFASSYIEETSFLQCLLLFFSDVSFFLGAPSAFLPRFRHSLILKIFQYSVFKVQAFLPAPSFCADGD